MHILAANPIAETIFILGIVSAIGLVLGSINFFGIQLEIAGVLFAGLFAGYLGWTIEHSTLHFIREFGLVLFVYSIGIQVGPGFFSSLRKEGLRLNFLAALIVIGGLAVAAAIHFILKVPALATVGLFSGATTNTPSLAAAQQAVTDLAGVPAADAQQLSIGYAIAYPFGIMGIILTMIASKFFFKVNVASEKALHSQAYGGESIHLEAVNLIVENTNLNGRKISELSELLKGATISRVKQADTVKIAHAETILGLGDIVLAVGTAQALKELEIVIGKKSPLDLRSISSDITTRRIVITRRSVIGKTFKELDLAGRQGIVVTRVIRRELELSCYASSRLEFGDVLVCVGSSTDLQRVASQLGNESQELNHPQMVLVFLGIAVGIILGSIPFSIPGMPVPVRLGLAGGPLLVAILMSRIGHIGPIVFHVPKSANLMMREIGIVLFLACVGLSSGPQFFSTVASPDGAKWLVCGAMITVIPLVLAAIVARGILKMNFMTLCGLLSGSMTDPPALAFANRMALSNAPALSYAAIYPLVMILRVVGAQVLMFLLLKAA